MHQRASLLVTIASFFMLLAACGGDDKPDATPTFSVPQTPPPATPTPGATQVPIGSQRSIGPLPVGAPLARGSYSLELSNGRFWPITGIWAPIGRKLATLQHGATAYLEVSDLATGVVRNVYNESFVVDWSPTGDAILVLPWGGNEWATGLVLAPVGGGAPRSIDITGLKIGRGSTFDWRPGHNNEVALGMTDDFSAVYLLNLDDHTKNKRIIAPGTQWGVPVLVDGWSQDGRWLLMREINKAPDIGGDVYAYDAVNATFHLLYSGCCGRAAWSPARNELLVEVGAESGVTASIYILSESDLPNAPAVLARTPIAAGSNAQWSPDGRMIAYSVMACGNDDWYTGVVNRDGSGKRRLPGQAKMFRFQTEWSPDSRYIAYAGYFPRTADHGGSGLFIYDLVENKEITLIVTPPPPAANPNDSIDPLRLGPKPWSADGAFLSFGLGGGFGFCD